ncbi:MAG: hypothetical protein SFY56_02385 [Bacteroidota bacterium]|nr:hypothetical protein [Bacteroidota bacterium]
MKIYILTQNYFSQSANPWNIQIDKAKVNITYLNSFLDRLKSKGRVYSRVINLIQTKILSYTDEGYGFSIKAIQYLKKNREIILPSIIIASSPAYSTCYFASKFKETFPEIKLINDYRDAWIDGFFSWNKTLTQESYLYKKQVRMEQFSLNNCDAIVTVTPELLQKLKTKNTNNKIKSYVITNGYDKRDYFDENLNFPNEFNRSKVNICHFGTLDFGRDKEFLKLISSKNISDKIMFYLIGSISEYLKERIKNLQNVTHIEHIPSKFLGPFLYYANFHLIINDAEFYYAYGSKIFDAMLYSRPIIFISKENSLIEKYENEYDFFHSNNSIESNIRLFERISFYKKSEELNTDYSDFDIKTLSNKYYQTIKELVNSDD